MVDLGLLADGARVVKAHGEAVVVWEGKGVEAIDDFPEGYCGDAFVEGAEPFVAAGADVDDRGSGWQLRIVAATDVVHGCFLVVLVEKV